ncbi:MAG: hypothetical protein IJF67_03260 [Clostridia bacterium]|nr:hypothetical protein [Clostridia bacterium]
MKITSIETIRVTIPLEAPILWSQGYRSATTRTLVKIHTDEGITGIGETRGDDGIEEMIQSIAAKLKGEDPFQIELVLEKFHMLGYFHGYFGLSAIAGVEIALWDIVGKATKQPLCNLLGGRYRDPVPFSGYIFYRSRTEDGKGGEQSPEEIVAFCERAVAEHGFDCLKLKGGAFPPEHDIAVLSAIRKHFGDKFKLRIDPNGCWSPQTAIKVAQKLDDIGLEYLEDPCWGIEGMSRLRKDIHIPIATNMCVVDFDTLPTGIRENAVDIILADAHKWGGIWVTKKLAAVCDAFRVGMSMHSGAELGVSTAVNLHLAASTPQITYSIDGHYHHIVDDIIAGGKHQYEDGKIKVPTGYGLGVELDEDKVAKYHALWKSGIQVAVNGSMPGGEQRHMSRSQY